MAKKSKYFHVHEEIIPLYGGILSIVLSNDQENVIEYCGGEFGSDNTSVFAHAVYGNLRGSQGFFMILNPYNEWKKMDHGSIAHEAYHIANYVSDTRGILNDYNNDEPTAYLVGYITNVAYKFIKEKKLFNKIK